MSKSWTADIEVRPSTIASWRLVERREMAHTRLLWSLVFGDSGEPTIDADGYTAFPPLGVTWQMPDDFHALVELRRRISALPTDMNALSRSQEEDDLEFDVLGPFSDDAATVGWITLARLEKYPWDTMFSVTGSGPQPAVEETTVRDYLRPYMNDAVDILARHARGENGRLVICCS